MRQEIKEAKNLLIGAYLTTICSVALLQTNLLLAFSDEPPEAVLFYFIVGSLLAIGTMILSSIGILKRTGGAGEPFLFDTWLLMFGAVIPAAGPFFALCGAVRLLRDRIGPATIRSRSGSFVSYKAQELHGSGVPAGLLLLFLGSLQPQLLWLIAQQETEPVAAQPKEVAVTEPEATIPAAGERADAQAEAKLQREIRAIEELVCRGVFECYTAADHVGPATGKLIVDLSAEGRSTDVHLRLASPLPQKVDECLHKLGEGIAIKDYDGSGGMLTCEFAGQVSGQVVSGEKRGRFVPRVEKL